MTIHSIVAPVIQDREALEEFADVLTDRAPQIEHDVARLLKSPADREITGGIVTEMAHDGDPHAREVLGMIGERLGHGLVGLVNVFNPEVIVIGGGAVRAGELLLGPARAVIAAHALPGMRDEVRVVPAHYGDEAGMMGAALMALESIEP